MSAKNILLVLTGGTICSFTNDNNERASDTKRAEALIVESFRRGESPFRSEECVKFHSVSPLNILSENMNIGCWNTLIDELKKYDYSAYDGVVVLHGTDTLAYTSALLSILFAGADFPVFLVSSALPLTEEGTNGNANFRAAVELILGGIKPNIYTVYRNYEKSGAGDMYIHYASQLLQCENYSTNFYSKDMTKIEESAPRFDGVDTKRGNIRLYSSPRLSDSVLKITPFVGINYDRYSLDGVSAVLHGTYHSSTLATDGEGASSALSLLDRCKEHKPPIPFFIEHCDADAYDYESTGRALRAGALAVFGMTAEFTYVKLLYGASLGLCGGVLSDYMREEINGEFIY